MLESAREWVSKSLRCELAILSKLYYAAWKKVTQRGPELSSMQHSSPHRPDKDPIGRTCSGHVSDQERLLLVFRLEGAHKHRHRVRHRPHTLATIPAITDADTQVLDSLWGSILSPSEMLVTKVFCRGRRIRGNHPKACLNLDGKQSRTCHHRTRYTERENLEAECGLTCQFRVFAPQRQVYPPVIEGALL